MMRHPGFKVFLASAFGAFIGSLVGLQFSPLFWWVGMLVGGVVGYVGYNPRAVIQAIPDAWRYVRASNESFRRAGTFLGRLIVSLACVAVWLGLGVLVLKTPWGQYIDHTRNLPPVAALQLSSLCILWSVGIVAPLMAFVLLTPGDWSEGTRDFWEALKFLNPVSVVVIVLPYLAYGFARYVAWPIVRGVSLFIALLFRLVHSDLRLLCGIDAAIGAAVGLIYHNPLLGALVGGLFGLADYELVSKRWLKLVRA